MTTKNNTTTTRTWQFSDGEQPYTGIAAVSLGQYEAYIGGEFITTLYSDSYQAALVEFHRLIEDYRSIPLFVGGELDYNVEWYMCQSCGASVDVGEDCPHCTPQPVDISSRYKNDGLSVAEQKAQVRTSLPGADPVNRTARRPNFNNPWRYR